MSMPPRNVASTLGTKRFFAADHFRIVSTEKLTEIGSSEKSVPWCSGRSGTPGTPWNTCPVLQMLLTGCENSFGAHGSVYFPRGHTKVATYGGLSKPPQGTEGVIASAMVSEIATDTMIEI